ncbi:MAG: GTP 3',8-cyclase MoaA [Kordiimonadaceae bacterium]|mgnify:CR=1 FL=1|jgi:GTP 3',8-cyclase|nr:GTP 3',8-cyclase MoaA [Kordiimonadaceae bacterium]MBT6031914.1 GTP 3',8-cyclase MoaA [Kordiimonadaceae bacterium]
MLVDKFNRSFPYLRLSITEVCNFSCDYCLPDGYQKTGNENFLGQDEINRLVNAFVGLGVWKIRLTGGEPTIRKDFTQIAKMIADKPEIETMAFTTNGYRLKERAQEWFDAGLNAINISIDSLNAKKFHQITGHNRMQEVRDGIDKALEVGFKKVKINVVLLKGVNDDELDSYLEYVRDTPVSVRYIELMQTGDNLTYFNKFHLSSDHVKDQLLDRGWVENIRNVGDGPAVNFTHSDFQGSIGLIAPYSKDFCTGCNRLRITSSGDLRLCLFGNVGIPLRHMLQSDEQKDDLMAAIRKQLEYKASSHFLNDGDTGIMTNLSSTGG